MTRDEAKGNLIDIKNKYLANYGEDSIINILIDEYDIQAIDMAIQALKQTQWIPCSERLPEFGAKVLCQCRAGIYEVLEYRSYGWYHDDLHCYMEGFVIAWMPLPESYKGEKA